MFNQVKQIIKIISNTPDFLFPNPNPYLNNPCPNPYLNPYPKSYHNPYPNLNSTPNSQIYPLKLFLYSLEFRGVKRF